jgi:adenosylcobinamide-phosphate synthase
LFEVRKMKRAEVMGLALVLDTLLGDPPNRFHPVAWMGQIIAVAWKNAPRRGRLAPLAYGLGLAAGGAGAIAGIAYGLERSTGSLPVPVARLAEAGLLKLAISPRGLSRAAGDVQVALEVGDLAEARRLVSWHLVSRDTSTLSASQVAAATVESVAENASDGVVAPLLYYLAGGLPAVLAYRYINTADAMLGYRDAAREWLGKGPARLDDAANWVAARVTAVLLLVGALLAGEDARGAWRVWRRDARKTASPNAGHPMSVVAGALGIEMEKVGHYRLGAGGRHPVPSDIHRSVRLLRIAVVLTVILAAVLSILAGKRHQS